MEVRLPGAEDWGQRQGREQGPSGTRRPGPQKEITMPIGKGKKLTATPALHYCSC
ncbi:hypothetical protein ACFC26_08625 [Kitasatospora purpeofusca]|uniref:hypothetical protein n=1 Tax=Kitasatospora purpeofusca TaxID=67352 RepID=UPI0035D7E66C